MDGRNAVMVVPDRTPREGSDMVMETDEQNVQDSDSFTLQETKPLTCPKKQRTPLKNRRCFVYPRSASKSVRQGRMEELSVKLQRNCVASNTFR